MCTASGSVSMGRSPPGRARSSCLASTRLPWATPARRCSSAYRRCTTGWRSRRTWTCCGRCAWPSAGPRRCPLPGVEVRLEPYEGGVAEIAVRGPNVIAGYLNRADPAFTDDGWFRTGDLGTLDDDGYLRISGRAKELIISGGYNVYPREVEEVLRAHPAVADAAVVGAPSAEWGETVVAFVVPAADGVAEVDLAAWCAERLAPYKRPRQWRWVKAIPRNALGKILRHELA